jgi:hypothetical protein
MLITLYDCGEKKKGGEGFECAVNKTHVTKGNGKQNILLRPNVPYLSDYLAYEQL